MFVRINTGWKAGQVQDIEPLSVARQMIADGRASAIDYDQAADKSEAPKKAAKKSK